MALARGCIWDVRRLHQNRSKVPAAIGFANKVQTRVVEMDAGDFEPASPQRQEPQVSNHTARSKDGLGAELGIFLYGKIRELKAG